MPLGQALGKQLMRFSVVLDADTTNAVKQFLGAAAVFAGFERAVSKAVSTISRAVTVTADAGDAAAVHADEVGLSAEAWQEYAWAAKIAGTEVGALRTALRRMGDNAVDATRGAGMATHAFAEIFGTVENMPKGQDELFKGILRYFAEMGDSADALQRKGGLMAQIFGRAGAKSAALFKLGPETFQALREEARNTGLVISEDLARATQKYNDELLRLQGVWTGIQYTIGERMLPSFAEVVGMTRKWAVEQRGLVLAGFEPWLRLVEWGLTGIKWTIDRLQRGFRQFFGPLEWVIEKFSWLGMLVSTGGALVMGVLFLAGAVSLLGTAFGFLSASLGALYTLAAPVIWPILAIGAALALAALAFDDFITLLRGGDSLLGYFLERAGLMEQFKDTMVAIGDVFENLKPLFKATGDAFNNMMTGMGDALGGPTGEMMRELFDIASWLMEKGLMGTEWLAGQTAAGLREMKRRSPEQAFTDTMQWVFDAQGPFGPMQIGSPARGSVLGGQPLHTGHGANVTNVTINGVHDPEAVARGVLDEANRARGAVLQNAEM